MTVALEDTKGSAVATLHSESVYPKIGTDFIPKGKLRIYMEPKSFTKHLGGPPELPRHFVRPLGSTFLFNLPFVIKSVSIFGHTG